MNRLYISEYTEYIVQKSLQLLIYNQSIHIDKFQPCNKTKITIVDIIYSGYGTVQDS